MIDRFLEIKKHLSEINYLLLLLPNHLEEDDILTQGFNTMKKFDGVTVMLQRDGMLFVESREIFDLFLKDYPDFEHYIGDNALIILLLCRSQEACQYQTHSVVRLFGF
jgi:hypothetical protein